MTNPLVFGEVLYDHFPDNSVVLGGAPFNVAWHLQAFGEAPTFISRVGDDDLGQRIRTAMQDWDMDTSALQLDADHPTGTVQIVIENGEPAYEIVPDQAYDFINKDKLASIPIGSMIYHGSLALRNPASHDALLELRRKQDLPVFVDVNLRAPWWDKDVVISLLKASRWAKLNDAELQQLASTKGSIEVQAKALQESTDLSLLIVTYGEKGALAFSKEGDVLKVEPETGIPVIDTVGAGDAFTSVMLLGLLSAWDLQKSLTRAQSFASAVVGIRGATPEKKEFYSNFIDTWS